MIVSTCHSQPRGPNNLCPSSILDQVNLIDNCPATNETIEPFEFSFPRANARCAREKNFKYLMQDSKGYKFLFEERYREPVKLLLICTKLCSLACMLIKFTKRLKVLNKKYTRQLLHIIFSKQKKKIVLPHNESMATIRTHKGGKRATTIVYELELKTERGKEKEGIYVNIIVEKERGGKNLGFPLP